MKPWPEKRSFKGIWETAKREAKKDPGGGPLQRGAGRRVKKRVKKESGCNEKVNWAARAAQNQT